MDRKTYYYQKLFKDYPDVVGISDFRKMLGGISEVFAWRLMRENRVKHFIIGNSYKIPKIWVIEYVLSDFYKEDKKRLKVQI